MFLCVTGLVPGLKASYTKYKGKQHLSYVISEKTVSKTLCQMNYVGGEPLQSNISVVTSMKKGFI